MRLNQTLSDIRFYIRKYPAIHAFIRTLHVIIRGIVTFPVYVGKVYEGFKRIKKRDKSVPTIWFVNVPSHANMGDQAMAYATRRLVSEQFPEYKLIELTREYITSCSYSIKYLKSRIINEDIVFVQGGYTSTDKSPNEKAHRIIASSINNRIIFMPQTVKYTSENEKNKTALIYNAHGNILFLCRDKVSYEIVKDSFTNIEVLIYPDIVSSLIGREQFVRSGKRNGVLLCIREDSEKHYSTSQINDMYSSLQTITNVDRADLMLMEGGKNPEVFHKMIDSLLEKMSSYQVIITDRFHGILFSIISETRVLVLDSIDYKVREGAMMFSKLIPGCCEYINNINCVPEVINKEFSEIKPVEYSQYIYDEYFKEFRKKYVSRL